MRGRINVLALRKMTHCGICSLFPLQGLLTSESKLAQEVRYKILTFRTWGLLAEEEKEERAATARSREAQLWTE